MRKNPRATLHTTSPNKTVWRIDWPCTPFKQGKTYFATTYPDSDLLFMETAAKRRPVSSLVGTKIKPAILAAIQRATTQPTAASPSAPRPSSPQ